jgi:hypothetical protein
MSRYTTIRGYLTEIGQEGMISVTDHDGHTAICGCRGLMRHRALRKLRGKAVEVTGEVLTTTVGGKPWHLDDACCRWLSEAEAA